MKHKISIDAQRLVSDLLSADVRKKGIAVKALGGVSDPKVWLGIIPFAKNMNTTIQEVLVHAVIPTIEKGKSAVAAYISFVILTEILPKLRIDELEIKVLKAIDNNRKIALGNRSRIFCESLRLNYNARGPQRRLTLRLFVALKTCPTIEAVRLAWDLLGRADATFKQYIIEYLCSFPEQMPDLVKLTYLPSIGEATCIKIYQKLFTAERLRSTRERNWLIKLSKTIPRRRLFFESIFVSPNANTSRFCIDLYKCERDPKIKVLLMNAIKFEKDLTGLRYWWNLSKSIENRIERFKVQSRISLAYSYISKSSGALDRFHAQSFESNYNQYDSRLSDFFSPESEPDTIVRYFGLFHRALRNMKNEGRDLHVRMLLRSFPDSFQNVAEKMLLKFVRNDESLSYLLLASTGHQNDRDTTLSNKIWDQLGESQIRAHWRSWYPLLVNYAEKGLDAGVKLKLFIAVCKSEAIKVWALTNEKSERIVLSDMIVRMSLLLGEPVKEDYLNRLMEQEGDIGLVSAVLQRSTDEEFDRLIKSSLFIESPVGTEALQKTFIEFSG